VSRDTSGVELRPGVFEISADGKDAGPVKYGETIEIPLEPGHHTLRALVCVSVHRGPPSTAGLPSFSL